MLIRRWNMRSMIWGMLAALLAGGVGFHAAAGTVSVATNTTNTATIQDINEFPTNGADMATGTFSVTVTGTLNGSSWSQTEFWSSTSATGGSASTSYWSLRQSGDTFLKDWTFDVKTVAGTLMVTSVTLSGFTGLNPTDGTGVVFDRFQNSKVTPDSEYGYDFTVTQNTNDISIDPTDTNYGFNIIARYFDPVMVAGSSGPQFDIFRMVQLLFSGNGMSEDDVPLVFRQDTDLVTFAPSPGPEIPTPAALPAGLVLLGIMALRRRRAMA